MREITNRIEKAFDVERERDERSRCERRRVREVEYAERRPPAEPHDERERETADKIHGREKDGRNERGMIRRTQMTRIDLVRENAIVVTFARERLHDAHADDIFVQHRVDPPNRRAYLAIALPRAPAKNLGRDEH